MPWQIDSTATLPIAKERNRTLQQAKPYGVENPSRLPAEYTSGFTSSAMARECGYLSGASQAPEGSPAHQGTGQGRTHGEARLKCAGSVAVCSPCPPAYPWSNNYLGVAVFSLSPAFGILGILYAVFTVVVAGLAVYALVLAIIFLRLRIAELKHAARPRGGSPE